MSKKKKKQNWGNYFWTNVFKSHIMLKGAIMLSKRIALTENKKAQKKVAQYRKPLWSQLVSRIRQIPINFLGLIGYPLQLRRKLYAVKSVTRREHLKSALYLRLKKRKTFFLEKILEIFEKFFLSENVAQCRKM